MKRLIIACAIALAGCGSTSELPQLASFHGTCVSDGVRIDASGSTAYHLEQDGEILIRNGQLVQGPCNVPIVGFDGESFDLTPASCDLEPGVSMYVNDGAGTLRDGVLTFKAWASIDRVEEGVTFEFTTSCEAR